MNAAQQQFNNEDVELIDGLYIDITSGEIVGIEGFEKAEFHVTDQASVDWVLERLLNAESAIEAIDKTDVVIRARAIVANAEKMQKEHKKRLEWFHMRFDGELADWARAELAKKAGKAGKMVKTVFGSIAFRTIPGRVSLRPGDEALTIALEYLEKKCPESIRREILISAVSAKVKEEAVIDRPEAFVKVPEKESVTIRTGVE